jgi:NAD(P)-dependent dehydrogenase (short-subunit alcohol dehydrogenase family)
MVEPDSRRNPRHVVTSTSVVTGPSPGGLGQYVAAGLARRGDRVVLAGRTRSRLEETAAAIRADVPRARIELLDLDLAELATVRSAAARAADLGPLGLLVNNAGVMAPPYTRTADGLDLQMATNHWGPFLLTGLLLPQLVAGGDSRVVTVSSVGHRLARHAPLHDPRSKPHPYSRWAVYGQTKVANLLFTFELDRRLAAVGLPVKALAAHPGLAGTHLFANGQVGGFTGAVGSILDAAQRAVSQSAAEGARPVLMAATADLPGSTYVGPTGFREARGEPGLVGCSDLARDPDAARRLWELSEETVGLRYP